MKQLIIFITFLAWFIMPARAKDVYMYSYFVGERSGLHLAYSYDGLKWTALNNNKPILAPTVGKDKLMRDPSIVQGPDGMFHMVWTSSWHERIIGYAESPDLIHWSKQRAIPVMKDEPTALNCWAPELYYDEPTKTYYIIWATTIPGRHSPVASTEEEKQWNHRIYYTKTKDFRTFTKTKIFFNPDFNVIDAAMVKDPVTKEIIMVLKNENSLPAEKNIRITRTKSLSKPFPTKVSAPITGNYWAEGPSPLFIGDKLYVYFDKYTSGCFGAVCSADHGKTWTDISDKVTFPRGIRHGTAFKVDEKVLENILHNREVTWDSQSLMMGGHRVVPVMGEIHYSRVPANEWAREVHKMKMGGVTMIACYVFWNHIEEQEGQFDWSGQRNLRHFLEICKQEDLPVILRLGPFCHGEVRNGGIPDWVIKSGVRTRSEDPRFLQMVEALYRQIFTQVQGLQWKDGGPVVAAQFDNEYSGRASYLLTLKKIARQIGFDLPFYTRTGWPQLKDAMPYGEMIPLFGDYADGFWDRSLKETAGNYWQAFHFRPSRANENIGSEQIDYNKIGKEKGEKGKDGSYPYFTCELGGGMMTSYHRRVYMYPEDAYAMATVKLGSGSNLLGYYMYHGGTNPEGKLTYLNENQKTLATNYNDLPVKTYDFQAPLGEFGQINPHFYMLRRLHLFMHDFGELLAPMKAVFPSDAVFKKGDNSKLRWDYRTKDGSAFVFVNNYERLQHLTAKKNVQFSVNGITFPQKPMTITAGEIAIFPVNIQLGDIHVKYATAQLMAKRKTDNGHTAFYFFQPTSEPCEFCLNGKMMKNVQPNSKKTIFKAGMSDIYLLTARQAEMFDLDSSFQTPKDPQLVNFKKIKEAVGQRTITIGVNKVAEEPVDSDFNKAAVYKIDLSAIKDITKGRKILDIEYQGDVARLYADGEFIDDNFYNGRHFQYGLWRLPKDCKQLELRILPIQKNMPVYFPREADTSLGEKVKAVTVVNE